MKSATSFNVVLVTAPSLTVARQLATAALQKRLIACANLVPQIESLYWWQDKIQTDREILLVLKTRKTHRRRLETLIRELHPYDTPEILALPIQAGNPSYLHWLHQETTAPA